MSRRAIVLIGGAVVLLVAGVTIWRRTHAVDEALTVLVRKGTLTAQLTATGTLSPAESLSYRSPLGSRETEITFLVAEGTRVNEGDLLARLDTTELQRDLQTTNQELRQVQVDLQVAEIDRQEGQAAVDSLSEGEGALSVDEARTRLQLSQKKVDRLKEEYDGLKPLMDKGFITKDELRKTADELEQAQEDLTLAKRKSDLFIERTHPQDKQRAQLQLAQKDAQLENVRARQLDVRTRLALLQQQLENCTMYARRPGLVVYEEYLGANPRRKVRVGDRVTSSQGLVTLPEVNRMLVQASVSEADVHRVKAGQPAAIRLEAFPDLRLTGKVSRVGTLAQSSSERSLGDRRFELVVEVDPTDAELRPEMTARVDVLLGERKDVLLVPVNAVFDHQGTLVCHVLTAFGVETRQVQVGEANDVMVEIASGLREGERVSLTEAGNPPGVGAPAPAEMNHSLRGRGAGNVLAPR